METLRLVNGRVIDPASGRDGAFDVQIDGGAISAVEPPGRLPAPAPGERVVDAKGMWVVPGLVDMHVHLRDPGEEYKEDAASGLAAAVRGGFTAVACMPNTIPPNDTRAVTEMLVRKAERIGLARLHPIAAVTRGLEGKELTEMGDLSDAGAVAFSDDGRCVKNANVMRRALEYARGIGATIVQHAEDKDLTPSGLTHEGPLGTRLGMGGWPAVAEEVIVARDLILAGFTSGKYHVAHASTAGTVEMIRRAKEAGLPVTAEVTPHHLVLTDEATAGYDTNTKVSPPLRPERDREALVQALAEGVIDAVASDHAPHSLLEKEGDFRSAAFGISGIETSLALLLGLVRDGKLEPAALVKAMSTNPARILGIRGGSLAKGDRADVTLIDPAATWVVDPSRFASKGKNSPFAGRSVTGRAVMTIVGGRIVHDGTAAGDGR